MRIPEGSALSKIKFKPGKVKERIYIWDYADTKDAWPCEVDTQKIEFDNGIYFARFKNKPWKIDGKEYNGNYIISNVVIIYIKN